MKDQHYSATEIGMASMGCISGDGSKQCARMGNGCKPCNALSCMNMALRDFPETRPEIVVASLSIITRTAKNLNEIRRAIPSMEFALAATA